MLVEFPELQELAEFLQVPEFEPEIVKVLFLVPAVNLFVFLPV